EAEDTPVIGRTLGQVAYFLFRSGSYEAGLVESDRALKALGSPVSGAARSAAGDEIVSARILSNRAVAHGYAGRFDLATADLHSALGIHRRTGALVLAAQVLHNLGFVDAQSGNMPAALRRMDEALAEHVRLGLPVHQLLTDRAEVLTTARLLPEARRAAEAAVSSLERAGLLADAAEARLALADVALVEGDLKTAEMEAAAAAGAFRQQRRPGWLARAESVASRAGWAAGDPRQVSRVALRHATLLAASGWRAAALEAAIVAAQCSLLTDQPELARKAASTVGEVRAAPAFERIQSYHLHALGCLAEGERSMALRHLRKGLLVADEHAESLRVGDLLSARGATAAELAATGIAIALSTVPVRPAAVLSWAERWRAVSLRRPPQPVSLEPELAHLLDRLRRNARDRPSCDVAELEKERLDLERQIRRCSLASAGGGARPAGRASPRSRRSALAVSELRAGLGERTLVELVADGGFLHAITLRRRGGVALHRLGEMGEVEHARATIQFALGRLTARRQAPPSLRAAATALRRAILLLDGLVVPLLGGVTAVDEAHGLIIVPTGSLYGVPWAMLPAIRGRCVTVAASAWGWLAASQRVRARRSDGPPLLASAPQVKTGATEISALRSRFYPSARLLVGKGATCEAVVSALDRAPVAHIVAHGRFRSDNPFLSSLGCSDGELTVHELSAVASPPDCLVLSACDAGRLAVRPGDDLTGVVSALLGIGAGAVVASVSPLTDAVMPATSLSFHSSLSAGTPVAEALLATRLAVPSPLDLTDDELASGANHGQSSLAASALSCFGNGGTVLAV
ncbi:MAG: CHAT domain-containing protein, partial [Acidimicrobiales bacterium]